MAVLHACLPLLHVPAARKVHTVPHAAARVDPRQGLYPVGHPRLTDPDWNHPLHYARDTHTYRYARAEMACQRGMHTCVETNMCRHMHTYVHIRQVEKVHEQEHVIV